MTRLRRIEDQDRTFFVTTNMARGLAPFTSAECDLILAMIDQHRNRGDFFLFGYVAMPTHVHLLISPQKQNLIRVMRDLKSKTGFAIARARGSSGPIWQARYFDTIIRRVRDFWQKLDYIHRNPVEAGLVGNPEKWKWSSYRQIAKKESSPIAVDPVDLPADGNHLLWPAPWR
jgi:putative transposase